MTGTAVLTETTLSQLIRDVSATMPAAATPSDIADAVITKAGDDLAGRFLLELVTSVVREVLGSERRDAMHNSGQNGSKKLERRRDWWQRTLDSRVAVGDGQWKRLGDCTADDLRHCVAEREELIKRTRLQIGNYKHLIAAMGKHKAKVVGDLKPEQVEL